MKTIISTLLKISFIFTMALSILSCGDMLTVGLGNEVDVNPPELEITSPAPLANFNSNFSLQGTVKDDIAVKEVIVNWNNGVEDVIISAAVNSSNNSWEALITVLPDVCIGQTVFSVYAVDTSGKKTPKSNIVLGIDSVAPTVLVKAPGTYNTGPTVSNYLELSGETYDVSLPTVVTVEVYSAESPYTPLITQVADGNTSWSTRIEFDPLNFVNDTRYLYRVTASDAAGNTNSYVYHSIDIWEILPEFQLFPTMVDIGKWDQDGANIENSSGSVIVSNDQSAALRVPISTDAPDFNAAANLSFIYNADKDIPQIKLSNLDAFGSAADNSIGQNTPIYASATDDKEGIDVTSIKLFVTPQTTGVEEDMSSSLTNTNTPSELYSSFEFDLSGMNKLEVGHYQARIELKDQKGITGTLNFVFVVDKGAPEISNIIISDNAAPFSFDSSHTGTETFLNNTPFGGPGAEFALQVPCRDVNGINSVVAQIKSAGLSVSANQNGEADGFELWETETFNVSTLTDGLYELEITVTDGAGVSSTTTRTLVVDNQVPTVDHESPRANFDILNGDVQIRGFVNDMGSGIASLEYKIGYDHATSSWTAFDSSMFSRWEIDLSGTNNINTYAHAPKALDSNSDGVWELPVYIRAVDKAGNVYDETSAAVADYVVLVNPDADKPTVDIIYPDPANLNRIIGGTIRIFGTAQDDDALDSVYMQVDVDGDGSYTASDYESLTGIDWYNGGEGVLVKGSGYSWNMTLNESGEFNPPAASSNTRKISFRVRAKDIYGTYGPWTSNQLLEIDKNVPQIGSTQAPVLKQASASQKFIQDMWIKNDWDFVTSIEDESNISEIEISGTDSNGTILLNMTLSANPAYFTSLTTATSKGYTLNLPLATSGTGTAEFTITAYDDSTPSRSSSAKFSFNYDNESPVLSPYAGTLPIVQNNKSTELTSTVTETGSGLERIAFYFLRSGSISRVYNPLVSKIADANKTNTSALDMTGNLPRLIISGASRPDEYSIQHSFLQNNSNIRIGGLIEVGGIDQLILSVDSASGTVNWSNPVDTAYTDAKAAYALVVDNTKIETPVWDASAVSLWPDSSLKQIINDDGDLLIEAIERAGGSYDWSASVDTLNIPDGPIEFHWVAYDKAGNSAKGAVSTQILNNRPVFSSVTLGTDINGNGTISSDETEAPISLLDGSGNPSSLVIAGSAAFSAKDKTDILLNTAGGNGDIYYMIWSAGADGIYGSDRTPSGDDVVLRTLTQLTSSTISIDTNGIDDILDLLGEGSKELRITLWDSTEETTCGVDSQWATLTLPLIVDVVDNNAPMAVIAPFFWNSESDNSLYLNEKSKGHIEITGVHNGSDPDVSGHISVRGTAYDDQRIDEIYMRIDTMAMSGITANLYGQTYTQVATYSAGTWIANSGTGWAFSATDVSIDQNGHHIEWQLDWDTATITNMANENINIKIATSDKGSNSSAAAVAGSSADLTSYNNPVYTVDVVPYITQITTPLSQLYRSEPSVFNRTALGKYPVKENDDISITGFNIADTATVSLSGISLGTVTPGSGTYAINIGSAAASGSLVVSTNGIGSINNLTDNALECNMQANGINNNLLNDDTVFDIWEFTEAAAPLGGGVSKPTMKISPSGIVGFSYANAILYFNMPGTRDGGSGIYSQTPYGKTWGGVTENTFAWDASNKTYGAALCPDTGSETDSSANMMLYHHDPASTVAAMELWDLYSGTGGIRLENTTISFDGGASWKTDVNRTQNIQMETTHDGTDTNLYMAYYDSLTGQIRFRSGQILADGTIVNNYVEAGGGATGYMSKILQPNDSLAANYHVIASNGTLTAATAEKPSSSIAMAVTGDGTNDTAVIAWYDTQNRNLNLSFNTSIQGTGFNTSGTSWITNTRTIDSAIGSGIDVDIAIDSDGGIHLAYYSTAGGDLKYAYLSSTSATPVIATVDSFLSVGTHVDITVAKETIEAAVVQVPYISYFMSSNKGTVGSTRLAHRVKYGVSEINGTDSIDFFTGNWEISTIPTSSIPAEDNVSVGIHKNADGTLASIPTATAVSDANTNTEGHAVGNSTTVGGNGTSNPAIAYATEDGILEMAQKK